MTQPPLIAGFYRAPFPAAAPGLPLVEMAPAGAGQELAAIGFALGWTLGRAQGAAAQGRLLFWAAPEASLAEHGAPYAEGLAQFGLDLGACLIARTRAQIDALWAAEQALTLPGAFVLCTVAPALKPLELIATRRLFLAAKKYKSCCVIIRLDAGRASAAQLRWEVSSAPAESSAYGLGAPAFDVRLVRNRAGPAGQGWRLQWCADEYAFKTVVRPLDVCPLDGGVPAIPDDRPAEAHWRRAG
ncbi:MAG: hypothetical protein ACKVS5_10950 [Parvularculaceae bacterium]